MAKGDTSRIQNDATIASGNMQNQYSNLQPQLGARAGDLWSRGTQDYHGARSGYSDFAQTGGMSQEQIDRMRGLVGDVGGGGIGDVPSHLSGVSFARGSAAGGVHIPDFSESNKGYREFADTGGFSADDMSNINRESLLDIERTGGYSDDAIANIRARSAAAAPSFYEALRDQMGRERAVTGNLAGQGTANFKLARQAAQQAHADRINTEIGLNEAITGNRMRAGETLAGNYLGYTGQRNANQLAGYGGLVDTGATTAQLGLQRAGLMDDYNLGLGGLDVQLASLRDNQARSDAAANASAASAGAAAELNFERWLASQQMAGRQFGIGGLHDLYNTNLSGAGNYDALRSGNIASNYGLQNAFLQSRLGATEQPFDWMGLAGGIAGGIGGAMVGGPAGALAGYSTGSKGLG